MRSLEYAYHSNNYDFIGGKLMLSSGSPEMSPTLDVQTGRLSGIVAHYVPSYLQSNRLPSWETNCIDDWEQKRRCHRAGNTFAGHAPDQRYPALGADVF